MCAYNIKEKENPSLYRVTVKKKKKDKTGKPPKSN